MQQRHLYTLIMTLIVCTTFLTSVPTSYADESVTFASTGQTLSDRVGFLAFWRANGGEAIFGAPLTAEIDQQGVTIQYFERARFEYHPELEGAPVLLGRIGVEYAATLWRTFPKPNRELLSKGATFFSETGYSLNEPFRTFWQNNGAIVTFGFPISEPMWESVGMKMAQVQYFERARLEFYPSAVVTSEAIRISPLGRDLALLYKQPIQAPAPTPAAKPTAKPTAQPAAKPAAPVSPTVAGKRIIVDIGRQWLYAYHDGRMVFDAPVSTGKDGFNTPRGVYAVYHKLPVQTMSGTIGGEYYYVPNVPSVMYINGGVALHGTYWHNQFGTGIRRSHGCINLPLNAARWLYAWSPVGTPVEVR